MQRRELALASHSCRRQVVPRGRRQVHAYRSRGSRVADPGELLKTGEVLERAAISRQVLHRYMQLDLIQPAATTPGGRNLYSRSVFKQIALIQKLNGSGYTLRDIREIFADRLRKLSGSAE